VGIYAALNRGAAIIAPLTRTNGSQADASITLSSSGVGAIIIRLPD
jgi:hypothetical protein